MRVSLEPTDMLVHALCGHCIPKDEGTAGEFSGLRVEKEKRKVCTKQGFSDAAFGATSSHRADDQ